MKPLISASILSADWSRLEDELSYLENAGVDLIHLDVMDGRFVPNITFGFKFIETLKELTNLPLDVHLMIEEPEKHIDGFIKAGSDILTVHAEATHHLQRLVSNIKEKDVKVGVAINPATPLCALDWVLEDIDLVLMMTVNPGFSGQKFIPQMLGKINQFKGNCQLSVDGGINKTTVQKIQGVDILVVGSYLFDGDESYKQKIQFLKGEK